MPDRTPVQSVAALVGVVFLLLGILAFVPGITTHYGALSFAGHGSGAKLLAVFQVSVLLDLVHVLLGVAGLVLARAASGARAFLLGGGAVCLVLWIAGLGGVAGWIPANAADNWLHFALGVGMVGLRLAPSRATV